jgi:drug/metabolite transporter (DMT)-like permease
VGSKIARSTTIASLLFLIVSLSWGGSYIAISVGLSQLPPILFAAGRVDVATLVLFPAVTIWYNNWIPQTQDDLLAIISVGLFTIGGSNALLFYGQQSTSSAVASVIFALNPVIATVLTWFLIVNERPNTLKIVGVFSGLIGVFIVADPKLSNLLASTNQEIWILCGGAFCLALGSVLSRKLEPDLSILVITAWGLAVSSVGLHLTSLFIGEKSVHVWSSELILALLYLGTVATAVAFSAYFALINRVGVVRAALVSYAVPAVTSLIQLIVINKHITTNTIVGFIFISCGFILAQYQTFLHILNDNKIKH